MLLRCICAFSGPASSSRNNVEVQLEGRGRKASGTALMVRTCAKMMGANNNIDRRIVRKIMWACTGILNLLRECHEIGARA